MHRSRLFAQHLPAFGWEPVILTVNERYYEEKLDWHLYQLIPEGQRIEKVNAYPVTKPRLIGDIGLRAFFQLRKKALELVRTEKINFVYIPIPSFYASLIGPYLYKKTGVKYGIDYIDPWVHAFPGSDKIFSRHWWSTQFAQWLEPKAVKHASLVTGVAEGYYQGVQERNPPLLKSCVFGAMPYGGEAQDHAAVLKLGLQPYLFEKNPKKLQLVYAGAFLPKAVQPLQQLFAVMAREKELFSDVVFHFIGTGSRANDAESFTIRPLAEQYGLYGTIVKEYPARIPYLDVLVHLAAADGVFVLGSTEPHYTPSKVYQAVLSKKPILAVLHAKSTAATIVEAARAGVVLAFDGEDGLPYIGENFAPVFAQYRAFQQAFIPSQVDTRLLENYSARNVTGELAALLNVCVP